MFVQVGAARGEVLLAARGQGQGAGEPPALGQRGLAPGGREAEAPAWTRPEGVVGDELTEDCAPLAGGRGGRSLPFPFPTPVREQAGPDVSCSGLPLVTSVLDLGWPVRLGL